MFNNKRLLIVAGPTGCGKSTFLRSAIGVHPSPLVKKILKKAFKRSDFKTQKLYFRRLQKLHEKQEGFKKFTRRYNNFILDIDTTGPAFKKNSLILPDFFAGFSQITSIQIYTPYDIWINRLLQRRIESSLKGSRAIRHVLHDSFSLKTSKIEQAKITYHDFYDKWESLLSSHGVKNHMRIDTIKEEIINKNITN